SIQLSYGGRCAVPARPKFIRPDLTARQGVARSGGPVTRSMPAQQVALPSAGPTAQVLRDPRGARGDPLPDLGHIALVQLGSERQRRDHTRDLSVPVEDRRGDAALGDVELLEADAVPPLPGGLQLGVQTRQVDQGVRRELLDLVPLDRAVELLL